MDAQEFKNHRKAELMRYIADEIDRQLMTSKQAFVETVWKVPFRDIQGKIIEELECAAFELIEELHAKAKELLPD